ncbi:hypothetical protein HQ533_05165 [Candidatus Woesearchaeota archaeon]|nr:hypothetical protein [Candidatus Woesearchaeota archaeon]
MIVWLCEGCGCELKQEDKPEECPLCRRSDATFMKMDRKDPDKEEKDIQKKYDKVVEKLEKYTKDCEPEDLKYSVED